LVGGLLALPNTLLLQAVGYFLGHVVLIMFGQYRIGHKNPIGPQQTFRYDALFLTKQVREDVIELHGHRFSAVGDVEPNANPLAADYGSLFDKPHQANALADYSERLQTEADNPFVWHTMGDLLLADGRPEQAAQAYDQARTIGLPWRMFWYSFGIFEAYAAVERYEDVIELADVTIESGGTGEEVYYWKGMAHRALGQEAAAQDAFRQALWWNPTHQPSKDALN